MAEPKVSILLSLVDKLSGPAESARTGLGKLGTSLKSAGNEAMQLLNNRLIQGVGLAGLGVALNKSFEAADAFRIALQKLEGTAKITGVPLDFLQKVAGDAEKQFGLSKTQASDFAVEMAKLASKAGDVGKAAPGLEAFLEIGAARGLTAQETLKAVQQSILGIDEGTDKLFNANPSVLYAQFAESIGTTAGKLTDQQKAQSLLTIAMQDGAKVTGTYGEFLDSTAGQLQVMRNKTEEAYATLGASLEGLRGSMASAAGFLATKAAEFVGGVQLMGAGLSAFLMAIPERLTLAMGMALGALAGLIDKASGIPIIGEKFAGVADSMTASADRMKAESKQALGNIREGYESVAAEIVGVVEGGQKRQTAAVVSGGGDRVAATVAEGTARGKAAADSAKDLEALEQIALKAQLEMLSAQQREYQELVTTFRDRMAGMTAADYRRAEELLKQSHLTMLMKWAGLNRELIPMIREPVLQLKPVITEFGERVAAAAPDQAQHEKWGRLKAQIAETGGAIGKGAEEILRFGRDIGATNPQLEALVGGIGRLAEGIGGIASGNLMGGIASGILGLQGIVGSLFGNSPAEQARKALLQRNTDALRELADTNGLLLRATSTGAQVEAAKGALPALEALAGMDGTGIISKSRLQAFRGTLQAVGLTMSDAERLAKDMGIGLGITGDQMSQAGVQSFIEGLRTAQFGTFEQSFGGQLERIEFESQIAGGFSPTQEIARIRDVLGSEFGSSALADAFAGVDLNSPEGRAQLLERLVGIAGNIENLPDGARDGLTGRDFTGILTRLTSLLRSESGLEATAPVPTFATVAPTTSAPVTVTAQAAADLLGPITETATNTRAAVDELQAIRGLILSGAMAQPGGPQSIALDALSIALQADRDLSEAAGVVP
jgi:hypothetical protein